MVSHGSQIRLVGAVVMNSITGLPAQAMPGIALFHGSKRGIYGPDRVRQAPQVTGQNQRDGDQIGHFASDACSDMGDEHRRQSQMDQKIIEELGRVMVRSPTWAALDAAISTSCSTAPTSGGRYAAHHDQLSCAGWRGNGSSCAPEAPGRYQEAPTPLAQKTKWSKSRHQHQHFGWLGRSRRHGSQ